MLKYILLSFVFGLGYAHAAPCAPLGLDKQALLDLRETEFVIEDETSRKSFAFDLMECLASPDPELRDKIGYEGFAALLRGEQLDTETIRQLSVRLIERFEISADEDGFEKPFVALVLSEIARTDRVGDTMTDEGRAALVQAAADYLSSVTDYRGFDENDGWRHGVAHGADFAMQLALNSKVTLEQLGDLGTAISRQVVPDTAHFYIYGEPERLARPILFMAARNELDADGWTEWWDLLMYNSRPDGWDNAYASQEGLAAIHNLKSFTQAVYVNASLSENEGVKALLPGAEATLRALP